MDPRAPVPIPGSPQVLVDNHVHFHPGFDELRFFRSARDNFSRAASGLELAGSWTGAMILTENAGSSAFRSFRQRAEKAQSGPWTIELLDDPWSLRIRDCEGGEMDRKAMVMVAGAQVETAEGLEVLVFPTLTPPPDATPVEEILSTAVEAGTVAILPWAFGKWSFGRGRLIARLIDTWHPDGFLLSDTGHRPGRAPYPLLLKRGEDAGIPVLAGSDPLPLRGEDRRPGSSCFTVTGPDFDETPALSLRKALRDLTASPPRFEQPCGAPRFLAVQLAMQARKQWRRWKA